jgi:hypothetical protein
VQQCTSLVCAAALDTHLARSSQHGAAAEALDARKIRNYREGGDGGKHAFSPLTWRCTGSSARWLQHAVRLLSTIAGIVADSNKVEQCDFVENALRKLSVGLCRGNGMLLRAGVPAVAKASGRAFQAGLGAGSGADSVNCALLVLVLEQLTRAAQTRV